MAAITCSLSLHTLALGEQRQLYPGREYWLSLTLFSKRTGIFAVPSGSPPEMARRELSIGFPWQEALLTAALRVELQRAGPCARAVFLPCALYALKCITYNQKMKPLRKRPGLISNFAVSSSSHHDSPCSTGVLGEAQARAVPQLGQSHPELCPGGHPGARGNMSVLNLFRMLTPSKSTPELDLNPKMIQSLPNALKAAKNKKLEGRRGGRVGGLT